MIAGAIWRHEVARDLLAWHALRTTEYPEGTTLAGVLGREAIPLDPRPIQAEEADVVEQARDRELVVAEAYAGSEMGARSGVTLGHLSEDELERAYAEASVVTGDES